MSSDVEKVKTRKDVEFIFESNKKVKQLQVEFFQKIRRRDTDAVRIYREMQRIRVEIRERYKILL